MQAGSGSFWSIRCHPLGDSAAVAHVLPSGGKGAAAGRDRCRRLRFSAAKPSRLRRFRKTAFPSCCGCGRCTWIPGEAGTCRGGLGKALRLSCHGVSEVRLSVGTDKTRFAAHGIAGNGSGVSGGATQDGRPMLLESFRFCAGSEVEVRLPGGGGVGDAKALEPAAFIRDVETLPGGRVVAGIPLCILPASNKGPSVADAPMAGPKERPG